MAFRQYQLLRAVLLVGTVSLNTLCTNWARQMMSKGSDGAERLFNHPFLQAAAMFGGETLCLLAFKVVYVLSRKSEENVLTKGNRNFNPIILFPAAVFDLLSTAIMYIGLTFTYPRSLLMFRGSAVLFVGVLSTVFLNKHILLKEWLGMANITIGFVIVGVTDVIFASSKHHKGQNSLLTGDILIIISLLISACHMVYEEKFISDLDIPPLQAVGWEGIFGFSMMSLLLFVFYWVPPLPHFGYRPNGTIGDAIDGLVQIGNNNLLLCTVLGSVISVALSTFAGLSITKKVSATHRMVLDSIRTIVIWMVSVLVKWQEFYWLHIVGFAVLILSICNYNRLLTCNDRTGDDDDEDFSILNI
ncbi:solute carrier family 35 member F6 [Pieris napi]|uniref:solute carrier family 35 member F6 n=1 Tax=Pieris napi TaxID=78633 RepID=UPI001FBB2343|nr:solute carrier family 35 member F6 [Pieris napi]XP_047525005.1 solute carrier family 35 member F6 [Pieris napi]XP_047525006.1 solute carrier family 35 member F6 [Pieris napi]XP_047525007.1 solute carrier family 35 member F6 [Pieris napi]